MPAHKQKGFTLIELLIVIAIIAVLSVIGVVIYSGIQGKARDARRKADLEQMATAYEVNYNSGQYISLAGTQFSSGQIPKDPKDSASYTCNKGPDIGCAEQRADIFIICATLEDGSTSCRQAAQGGESIAVVMPSPSPSPSPAGGTCDKFKNNGIIVSSQTCRITAVSWNGATRYLKCSDIAPTVTSFDCTAACLPGSVPWERILQEPTIYYAELTASPPPAADNITTLCGNGTVWNGDVYTITVHVIPGM